MEAEKLKIYEKYAQEGWSGDADAIGFENFKKAFDEIIELNEARKRLWHFDCWDRSGAIQTITIAALNEENAIIIFKAKHSHLNFDSPY